MKTVEECYALARTKNVGMKLSTCFDFGNFYGFAFRPYSIPDNEPYISGPFITSVDKTNGEVTYYNITDDTELYFNAKKIDVPTIMDEVIHHDEQ